jgi:hypothetical protein
MSIVLHTASGSTYDFEGGEVFVTRSLEGHPLGAVERFPSKGFEILFRFDGSARAKIPSPRGAIITSTIVKMAATA